MGPAAELPAAASWVGWVLALCHICQGWRPWLELVLLTEGAWGLVSGRAGQHLDPELRKVEVGGPQASDVEAPAIRDCERQAPFHDALHLHSTPLRKQAEHLVAERMKPLTQLVVASCSYTELKQRQFEAT